ncbi:MAG TPA: LamB/YcsF family protein, partial [Opitutaceae bacterium]|nr:LamB/YcsF family protein [Opitutaceae bacterium]
MNVRSSIDLNADVGEGCGWDAELIPLVSCVNVACGAHAGDLGTMRLAVALAQRHGAAIGAHPGFADRENFGRSEMPVSPPEAAALVVEQARLLQKVAACIGAKVGHVKLHGALYSMASRDRALATAVVEAL